MARIVDLGLLGHQGAASVAHQKEIDILVDARRAGAKPVLNRRKVTQHIALEAGFFRNLARRRRLSRLAMANMALRQAPAATGVGRNQRHIEPSAIFAINYPAG